MSRATLRMAVVAVLAVAGFRFLVNRVPALSPLKPLSG